VADLIESFGASVRGPLHQREGRPNEDAWLRCDGQFGSLIVVCDGMGSRPHARIGSKAACDAAREAVVCWSRVENAPVSYLLHLLEVLWRLRIHPHQPDQACTTCLVAIARRSGEWIVAGLGDGLVLSRTGTEPVATLIGDRGEGFGNTTLALGASAGLKSWKVAELPPTSESRVVILATDGVGDDLMPEKHDAFCDWLCDEVRPLPPQVRWRTLVSELQNWPTPKHLDDKSLAVLYADEAAHER